MPQVSSDPLLNRFFLSPEERKKKENGKAIVQAFYRQQTSSDLLAFFQRRNAKWIENLLWAKGLQPMQEFLSYMSIQDANKAWVNIDTTQQRQAVKFIGTLVQSMAKNVIYPCVAACDDGSMNEKEDRLLDALFRMNEVETIDALQQMAGAPIEPPTAFVPDDEVSARVFFELEDRLPKEIKFEEYLRSIMKAIHFERIANRKTIFDLIAVNFAATKIERLAPGEYTVRKCIPTNCVYNFFMNDTGEYEITQFGEFYNLKVKDFRSKFGRTADRPDGLTEKEIFELAKQSSNKSLGTFNYNWQDMYGQELYNLNRPYDDCNIYILDCEINCGEEVYFVSKKDNYEREVITEKTGIPFQQVKKDGTIIHQDVPEDTDIIKGRQQTWMRGVYAPHSDTMLYWGRPDLIISQYTDTTKPLSSYTVNIPNNDGDYVPSLFERILEPLREYTLTKLKRKQLISQLTRTGYKVDVENSRNLDLGNGNTIDWEEVVRIKNQTGIELWSSKGVNPLLREQAPISPGTPEDTIQKIIGLSEVLNNIVAEIRDLIGVPPYRDGADVGERTSGTLQEGQLESSFNVTDYITNANAQLWEETFYKLCLLKWNDIVKSEPESKDDMLNTRFDVKIRMKMTDYEKQLLERDIDRFSQMPDAQGNPLLTPKDALMLRNIENYTMAAWYLDATVKKNRRLAQQEVERATQMNAQLQQESAAQKAESDMALLQEEEQKKLEAEERKSQRDKELELLKGVLAVAGKDESGTLIREFLPAIQQLVPNITLPLAAENQQIASAMQQAAAPPDPAQMQMQEQQMMQQGQPQPMM